MLSEAALNGVAIPLQFGTSVIFEDGLAVVIDAMRFNVPPLSATLSPTPDYLYWAMIGTQTRFGIDETHDLRCPHAVLTDCIEKTTQRWHPQLKALFTMTDAEMLTLVPVKTAETLVPWAPTRVTALGDAIHTMSPAGGLGANSALHDAAVLVDILVGTHTDSITEAIANYERQMRDHSNTAVQLSRQGAKQLIGGNEAANTDIVRHVPT